MDLNLFLTETLGKSTQHRRFYHFTDRKNLPLIREHGLLSTRELKRRGLLESVKTGGDENSMRSDSANGTDLHVCLCFTCSHPMAHVAKIDERKLDPTYLEIDPKVIQLSNVTITSAPSNQNGVSKIPASQALDSLDLDVIYKRMDWSNSEINARLRTAEKYEILIPGSLAKEYILKGL